MTDANDVSGAGRGVDRFGRLADDPTKNVRELVEVEKNHAKEIRDLIELHNKERRDSQKSFDEQLRRIDIKRIEQLAEAETRRMDHLAALRLQYDTQISQSRDVQTKTTSDLISKALDKVTDSLGQQINTAIKSFADQLETAIGAIVPRIADLERFRWETGGASRIADPALEKSLSKLGADINTMQGTFAKTMADMVSNQADALAKVTKSISAITEQEGENRGVSRGRIQAVSAIGNGVYVLAAVIAGFIAAASFFIGHSTSFDRPQQFQSPR